MITCQQELGLDSISPNSLTMKCRGCKWNVWGLEEIRQRWKISNVESRGIGWGPLVLCVTVMNLFYSILPIKGRTDSDSPSLTHLVDKSISFKPSQIIILWTKHWDSCVYGQCNGMLMLAKSCFCWCFMFQVSRLGVIFNSFISHSGNVHFF